MSDPTLAAAFSRFATRCVFGHVEPQPGGLINRSWRVTAFAGEARHRFILQRMNTRVFAAPADVMDNVALVTDHLRRLTPPEPTLEFLPAVATSADHPLLWQDAAGAVWRLCRFIENTQPVTAGDGPAGAQAAGRAYGRFLRCLADFPADHLHETLPGFHATPDRWAACRRAHAADPCGRAAGSRDVWTFLQRHADLADLLADRGLPRRVVHNDAKLGNVLLPAGDADGVCVVDLDTVMPGTPLHDFGDLVRTACCTADEEEIDFDRVAIDPERYDALVHGYLGEAGAILEMREKARLYEAGLVIVFEQAVRFLTDHLQGDRYYHTVRSDHNLDRSRNQVRLLSSLLALGDGSAAD